MQSVLTIALLLTAESASASVCEPVESIDYEKYVGRWYNVYYDKFTTIFSSPDCATAYYALDATATVPTLTVNNSGLARNGSSTFLTGSVAQTNAGTQADLVLRLDGVPRDATYRICALGEPTYGGAGYYQYSIVTDDSGLSLYVLARDVDEFFERYDDEVSKLLEGFGYSGFLWGASANKQANCPPDIYYPPWDPSSTAGAAATAATAFGAGALAGALLHLKF